MMAIFGALRLLRLFYHCFLPVGYLEAKGYLEEVGRELSYNPQVDTIEGDNFGR